MPIKNSKLPRSFQFLAPDDEEYLFDWNERKALAAVHYSVDETIVR
jgi:hypothetical protein